MIPLLLSSIQPFRVGPKAYYVRAAEKSRLIVAMSDGACLRLYFQAVISSRAAFSPAARAISAPFMVSVNCSIVLAPMMAEVTAAIRDHVGETPQSDDMTLVVLKRD